MNIEKILIALIVSCLVSCENLQEMHTIVDGNDIELRSGEGVSFNFTVKPGTEAWNLLETEQERIDALQVPKDILAALSSEELVRLCIEFPHFGYFTAFNTPQEGFAIMLERFNIFEHLTSRKDIGKGLIAVYKDADFKGFRTLPYSNEHWIIKLYYIELLLAQKEILQSLTLDEKLELLAEARAKYTEKINNEAFSSLPGCLFTIRIMASILDIDKYPYTSENAITQLINMGWSFEKIPSIDAIIKSTDDYINSKK